MAVEILGPLSVDGDANALAPRDRVVLAALVLRPGDVVSVERLADALWGECPPASWGKVVPGCVLRLRRLLGVRAIETAPHGYRLILAADEVDAHRFERMVNRGRELLTVGEPERAAHVIGDALALWRGAALVDLENWEPGRIEARRLEQLRLDAEEDLLDAALRAGRCRQVLGDAQAKAAEAPLRERRWALLALAMYQAGRQGEALRALRRARMVLAAELGVNPGTELVALEQAVLQHDPSLLAAVALPEPSGTCPYQGLMSYDIDDADAFFGRDADVVACLRRLTTVGVLAVVGPSGSGKSSLVCAGVAAAVQRDGGRVIVITPNAHPMDALTTLPLVGTVPMLVVDQCERAFTMCDDPGERTAFFKALTAHASRGPLVVALRADRMGDVSAHPDFARVIEPGLYLLSAMGDADLRTAIEGPARQAGLLLEAGLVDLLVRDVEGEPGALPLLSHALRRTWECREDRTLTVAGYRDTGGIRGAVAQSAEEVYARVPNEQRRLLRDLLLRLVAATPAGEPVRSRIPRLSVSGGPEQEQLVELLVAARLVTSDDNVVELAHEALARAWPRLRRWLDDDIDGQRIMRHLSSAAEAWDRLDRPASDLYRGARLAQALDWRTATKPHLTSMERSFLEAARELDDTERRAAEDRAHQQSRSNRRLRGLLAGVGVLLVAAIIAGLAAVREADRADQAAIGEEVRRLGAQALLTEEIDVSLLLAIEGVRLDDSSEARSNLLAALGRERALIGSIRDDAPLTSVDVSADGATVAIGDVNGELTLYDAATRERINPSNDTAAMILAFRPDGDQLAIGEPVYPSDPDALRLRLVDPTTLVEQAVQLHGMPGQALVANLRYSSDGDSLAVTFDAFAAELTIAVWDLATPNEPVGIVKVPGSATDVALSRDGRRVYTSDRNRQRLTMYDVRTGRSLKSVNAVAGRLVISPDDSLVAMSDGPDIVLFDAATLAEGATLQDHDDPVSALQFSHNGALLASASDGGELVIWDVPARSMSERLSDRAGSVQDLAFDTGDDTVYTAALDGSLLIWDVSGDRRVIARHVAADRRAPTYLTVPDPTGAVVAVVTESVDSQGQLTDVLQFRDLTTGRLGKEINIGHSRPRILAWRPHSEELAVVESGRVHVWAARTGSQVTARSLAPSGPLGHLEGPEIIAADLDYTPNGARLVIAGRDAAIRTLDAATLEPFGKPLVLPHRIVAVSASPDGRTAIAVTEPFEWEKSTTSSFALVDLVDGDVLHEGELPFNALRADFSPDGQRVVVIGSSDEVGILDITNNEWVTPPSDRGRERSAFASFTPDGDSVVIGGPNGTVSLRHGATSELLASVIVGRTSMTIRPMVLADGHTAMLTTSDGAVYTWDTRPESWIDAACAIAGRNLTEDEWRNAFDDRPYRPSCPDHPG